MHQSSFQRSRNRPPLPPKNKNQQQQQQQHTQFTLPGDFYGPPQNYGDGRGSCCKFFTFLILFLILIVVTFVLSLWFVLRPDGPDFSVDSTTLTYYSHLPTAKYKDRYTNFMVETRLRIRNPNKKIKFYYELRELESYNSGGWWYLKKISSLPSTIEQGTGNNSLALFKVTFQSDTPGVKIVDDRKNITNGELGNVDLRFYGWISLKIWKIKTNRFPLKITCDLLVPVEINGKLNSTGSFRQTDCKVRYYY